jgi:hypothetical protein
VRHHIVGHVAYVLGEDVVAAADQREGAGGGDQAEAGARAGTDLDHVGQVAEEVVLRLAGGHDKAHDVVGDELVDRDLGGGALQLDQPFGVEDLRRLGGLDAHPLQDLELVVGARVGDVDLHQEPVALGLGQRVDAFGLDGVLGGDDDERLGQRERAAGQRHLAFGHDLEQRRLHLGGGTVDLVGEDEVDEDRPHLDVELLGRRVVDPRAHDVRRDQVGGELQAGEAAADDLGEGADRQRLGHAGHTLEQTVALGQESDDHAFDHVLLADDDLLDLPHGLLQEVCGLIGVVGGDRHPFPHVVQRSAPCGVCSRPYSI